MCVRVIGMECDAAMWVLACRFIDGVALSGARSAEKNPVARCVDGRWGVLWGLMVLCFRPTVQPLQFGVQVFELVGCWVVRPQAEIGELVGAVSVVTCGTGFSLSPT